jgi:hypothetical protein
MSAYLIISLVFGTILAVVWFVFGKLKPTVYLNKVGENASAIGNDIEASKKQVEKIRSRRFVVGVGATIGLCILSYIMVAAAAPARKVQAALWPTATPTVTQTRTVTPTRTPTTTPRLSSTPHEARTQTAFAKTGSPTVTSTIAPSGSNSSRITIIQTQLVVITKIVYVPQTVMVTITDTSVYTFTPSVTPTITSTGTMTETPTGTPTLTPTETETPTP